MDSFADASIEFISAERRKFEPWESGRLKKIYTADFEELSSRPFRRHIGDFDNEMLGAIAGIIEAAYSKSFYINFYSTYGLPPEPNLSCLGDMDRFPVTDKAIMSNFLIEDDKEKLFKTWTCGTSGCRRFVFFDLDSIIIDTLQGVRQLLLQSSNNVTAEDVTTHYYPYPWYVDRIGEDWRSSFIPSTKSAAEAAQQLRKELPTVLYGYPSDISCLTAELEYRELSLKLIITNSEQSSRSERKRISDHFGCPVLDEYSSEELTRIALEMPDGHYYVHEDSVYLEVLDPYTRQPTPNGQWGEAVATGLLNKVMPFIRYATGDLVMKRGDRGANQLGIGWQSLGGIGGRVEDSFLHPDGSLIPSSVLLEQIESGICERGLKIGSYCLDQRSLGQVTLTVSASRYSKTETADFKELAKEILALYFHPLPEISADRAELNPKFGLERKRRPVRSTLHRERLAGASKLE